MPNSPHPLLARRPFVALAVFLAAIALLKAVRLPNRWAATNFVLNYSQGFVRRGLMGEVARRLLGDAAFHYRVFVVLAFVVMVALAAAFVWLCRRSLAERDSDVELKAAILVFVASPGLVLLVHLVGYLDHLGLLFVCAFAAATTSARAKWQAYAVAALTGPVLALVHEAQTILFMPVVLFVLACRECRAAQGEPAAKSSLFGAAWRAVLPPAAVLALALGVSAYVSVAAEPRLVGALDHWLHQRADFTLHYGVFRALKTGSPVSLLDTMYDFWSGPGQLIWWFKAAVLFLPSYVFLIVCGWRAIGGVDAPARGVVAALRGLFLVACASPLVLNVVAWDYARWFALAVSNALICLLAFRAICRARPTEGGGGLLPLGAAMTIALGLAGDAIFFNGAKVSYYPFFDQWQALGDQLKSGKIESPKD